MKQTIFNIFSLIAIFLLAISCVPKNNRSMEAQQSDAAKNDTLPSIHQYKIASLNGDTIDFSQYKGKYILVVNTASKCGFTPQYKALQEIYELYGNNLVVIGFPSDNFMNQEFGSNTEIADFCEKNYGVTFPLTTKVDVKGKTITPVYQFLTDKNKNGVLDATISWNFNKFLLDKNGQLIAHFGSKVKPDSEEILNYIR